MSITMYDWFLNLIEKISRGIFHWTWRVQTKRRYKAKKNKK